MNTIAAPSNRYSFVNILCYLLIIISSINLIKALIKLGRPEKHIKAISSSAADRLSDWQLNLFQGVHSVMQQQLLLIIISIAIAAIAIVLAVFAIKRLEWARKGLIVFFLFKAVIVIITFGFTFLATHILVDSVTTALEDGPLGATHPRLSLFFNLMAFMGGIFTIGIVILHLWVVKRLRSDIIKSQFQNIQPGAL